MYGSVSVFGSWVVDGLGVVFGLVDEEVEKVVGDWVGLGDSLVVVCSVDWVVSGGFSELVVLGAVVVEGVVGGGVLWSVVEGVVGSGVFVVSGGCSDVVEGTCDVGGGGDSDEGEGGTVELVELSAGCCRFASFIKRAAKEASSLCRASTALVSVGKTPSRNLSDSRCRARWIEDSSMFPRTSCREGFLELESVAVRSVGETATATATEEMRRAKRR